MNTARKYAIPLLITLVLFTLACGLENIQVVEAPNLEATITAQAVLLQQGGQPAAVQDPAQQAVIVVTATPDGNTVSQPVPVQPSATGDVTVTVTAVTNCRTGPSQSFNVVYEMPIGQAAKVVAKNSYSGYWIIEIPGKSGQTCWLWGKYAVINGDTSTLKEVATPTSPAPTITNTPKPTNTVQPTATSTTAAAVAPNAPQILTSFVTCSDAGGGNRNYAIELNWADNSNNETMFVITTSSNRLDGKSPNATSHTLTEVLPAGTNLTVSLSAQNGTGSSAPVSTSFSCP